MAEVEKVSTAAAGSPETIATAGTSLSDIGEAAGNNSIEYGTSPTQERSSNSHPHDSEYDTASDLEGCGEEYDDDEEDDESMTDGESITDDDDEEEEDDGRRQVGLEKAEIDAQKKVDEDRSNPQYIPKRGTFYEHDDRTVEVEADGLITLDEVGEPLDGANNGAKAPQSPTISHASKTMKKWQPASAVERWSHDRFDASEQAPKSRTELVSAYGYDIRTEDAPPRARRRRRYGRGPSKYSRNWEDESAYLKASNKERKPPRPSEFPILNERSAQKTRKAHVTREEKENRLEKRTSAEKSSGTLRAAQLPDERRDTKGAINKGKSHQTGNNVRQVPMEFKQKQRSSRQAGSSYKDSQNIRNDIHYDRQGNRHQTNVQRNSAAFDQQSKAEIGKVHAYSKHAHPENTYGQVADNQHSAGSNKSQSYQHQVQQSTLSQLQSQQQSPIVSMRQQPQSKTPPSTSNLSQRLQQVQNRNDPSHVGSVQMHALATQNQIVGQQQQLTGASMAMNGQQGGQGQQPQTVQIPQEQRGPPKRYSSLRRSQHEAQHITEQMQQMHLQQQPPPMLIQDQHMLQANLMQLYHQENLQAQMQALQASQNTSQAQKPASAYTAVPTPTQGPPYPNSGSAATTPAAFYVASSDVYTASATANPQTQPPGQYGQPTPTNYLPPASATAAATLAYPGGPPSTQPQVPTASAAAYGPATAVSPSTSASAPGASTKSSNSNFSNYQNYNTVGGTTYFVPPAQATSRPVVLPQRRPTNAIPILPPSEKNKRTGDVKEEAKQFTNTPGSQSSSQSTAPIGSAENIDHIIDNMFVQRPAFQPQLATATNQTRKSSSPLSNADNGSGESSGSCLTTVPPTDDVVSNSIIIKATGDKSSNSNVENALLENTANSAIIKAQE